MRALARCSLLLICVLAVGAPSSTQAATPVAALANVRVIYHGLTVQVPHRKASKGKKKQRLYSQYLLRTGKRQEASIAFRDSTVLDLNQLTDAVLHDPKVTIVKRGEIDEIDRGGTHHQVRTATATASAIGTNFDVRVQGNQAVFIVDQGKVRVQTKGGQVLLHRNQETTVVGNGPPSPPQTVDADAAIGWTAQLAVWQLLKYPFSAPSAIAHDSNGNIYIGDSSQGHVTKLSSAGALIATFGTPGKSVGQLTTIGGVAVDTQGNVFVSDDFNNVVDKLSPQGKYLSSIGTGKRSGGPLDFIAPKGVAIDSAGNLYVCDSGGSRIQKISPSGNFVNSINVDTGVPLNAAFGMAFDGAGNGWIADTYNNRIVEISPSEKVLARYGSYGAGLGKFRYPFGIAIAPNGNVWVADTLNEDLQELSSAGQPIMLWNNRKLNLPREFFQPTDITIDNLGTVYVLDNGNKRVEKLSP
jgi:streptogramin lyase